MFKTILAASAAAIMFTGSAKADISADLKFCAGLKNGKERLACYDAAARIEKRGDRKVVTHAPSTTARLSNTMAYSPPPIPPKSRFDGAYAGAAAGYDIPAGFVGQQTSLYRLPIVENDGIRGAKLGLVAGYNATSGPLLLGFEARAMYNFNETSASATNTTLGNTPPFITSWQWCGSCDFDNYPTAYDPKSYSISSSNTQTLWRSRPWQADFALRTGIIFNEWMVYGKYGVGLEETKTIYKSDSSASVTCTSAIVEHRRPAPAELEIAIVGCSPGGIVRGGPVSTTITRSINPTAIFGVGVERNFGNYFARVEAEMIAHLISDGAYYTPAANFTIGYRF